MEPIEVSIVGTKTRVLPADPFEVSPKGELMPGRRKKRLIQFYSDRGMRTVTLAVLSFR